jgi:DNA repair exonuclease SbcCD ATPase subunit
MGTDFFDDDLLKMEDSGTDKIDRTEGVPTRPISDASLTRMMKQKDEVMHQVANATQEIEQLRMRQEALEKEKADLQDLTRRQEEYEKEKQEIVEKLIQSIVMLEKEETQATRMVEILSMMRTRFKDSLAELKAIDEAKWQDESFAMELNKAVVVVEEARTTYRKALAKIDAVRWQKTGAGAASADALEESAGGGTKSFRRWFVMGLAVSLPLMLLIVLLFLVYAYLQRV